MICDKYDLCEFAGDSCDVACMVRAARIDWFLFLRCFP
jgi:hypothetical protein